MEPRKFPPAFDAARMVPAAHIPAENRRKHRTPWVVRLRWVALLTLAVAYASIPASASSNGISGFSGKNGSTCTSCHSSGTAPTVTMTGPTSVASGSTSTYTISVSTVTSGNGGVDVAASAGTFAAGTGTKVLNGEIVHSSPSTTHSWTFSWTAPT
ncbi:MAG: choice-of-anchor V domain-containing protein, partial [Terriglobales bacterium]